MNQIVRFWIVILSFAVSFGAFSYLFLSFWAPDAHLVTDGTEIRLLVMAIAVVGIGVFTWAAVFLAKPETETQIDRDSKGDRGVGPK